METTLFDRGENNASVRPCDAGEIRTQREKVLDHLVNGGSLTPREARALFGIDRLAARVCELRNAGHVICGERESPHRYVRYRLVRPD